jgi:16S rRNA G966 N2-methylase RsmD
MNLETAIKTKKNNTKTRKIYEGHRKGNFFFSNIPKKTRNRFLYDDEALFSITDSRTSKIITHELLSLKNITRESTVTDMTACVGGNVISFSQYFSNVNAIEIDHERFKMLKHNVNLVSKKHNVNFFEGNGIDIILNHETKQDIIFMDPPWGGKNYSSKSQISLFLTDDEGHEYNICDLIIILLQYAKYIAIKVPVNFNINELKQILKNNKRKIVLSNTNLRKMHLYIIA